MVIKELLKQTVSTLRESGNDNYVFEAHAILRHVLKLSATDLVLMHEKKVTKRQEEKVLEFCTRRTGGEPLQYILGTQEFMSLEFKVTPNVLIPRADTEALAEYVIEHYKDKGFSLLDIGTGSGCIPLSVAAYCPRALVRGVDVSDEAIKIANENCKRLTLSHRAAFGMCDIMSELPRGKYDVITSNPPYIETDVIPTLQTEVKDFEPHLALDGGADGLMFYRRICEIAPMLLNKGGMLIFEIGCNQGKAVTQLMEKSFGNVEIIKDIPGNDRVAVGSLKNMSGG